MKKKKTAYLSSAIGCLIVVIGIVCYFLFASIAKNEGVSYLFIDDDDDMDSVSVKLSEIATPTGVCAVRTLARHMGYTDKIRTGRYLLDDDINALQFFRNLRKAEENAIKSFRTLPPYEASQIMYRFVMSLLGTKGLVPGSEQFYDFAERVDGSIEMKGANVFMMDVMPVFEKCEFGNAEISPVSEDERNAVYTFTAAVYRKVMEDCSALKRIFLKISLFL